MIADLATKMLLSLRYKYIFQILLLIAKEKIMGVEIIFLHLLLIYRLSEFQISVI